jgi:hypothetical protein
VTKVLSRSSPWSFAPTTYVMGNHSDRTDRIIRGSQLFAVLVLAGGALFVSGVSAQPLGSRTVAQAGAVQPAVGVAIGRTVRSVLPVGTNGNLRSVPKVEREDVHRAASKKAVDHAKPHPAFRVAHSSTSAPVAAKEAAAKPSANPNAYGCGAALAYLQAHAAPGFKFECPGWADGEQAMTCINMAGICPGTMIITISTPCAAAYMNEASNSWVLTGKSDARIDPYGYCS